LGVSRVESGGRDAIALRVESGVKEAMACIGSVKTRRQWRVLGVSRLDDPLRCIKSRPLHTLLPDVRVMFTLDVSTPYLCPHVRVMAYTFRIS